MYNKIRQRIENNLIDEIKNLSATDLEYVGNHMLSVSEKVSLVHHGTNKEGRVCGYTVDSFSQDVSIVGEYSVQKDYFTDYVNVNGQGSYRKIHKDVVHAVTFSNSTVKKIYLITSQEEIPSFRKKFNKTRDFLENGDMLHILDARLLAQEIYKQTVDCVEDMNFYRDYFPNFVQEVENYEYYGKIPALCDNFCQDTKVLDKIDRHFKNSSICLLYGVSGSGKTQTAIEYVHYKASEFQNYIWLSGEDWVNGISLSAIQRTRGGVPINVVGLFNKAKTILIIDSLEREVNSKDFSELSDGIKKGGKIIVTSQVKSYVKFCMAMPELSEEVAIRILGETSANGRAKQVANKCKGFPIMLSAIRNIVLYEGVNKEALYSEILEKPEELVTSGGTPLFKIILSKLSPETKDKLIKLANTGITMFDIDFARFYCGVLGCNALQKLSILISTNVPGIVKIHDLICVAMFKQDESNEAVQKLKQYIADKKGEMTPSILRQIYLMRYKIAKYKEIDTRSDWLTYALLQIEGNEKNEIVEKLYGVKFDLNMELATVKCLIESKELKGYYIEAREKREEYLENLICEYENILNLVSNLDIKAELLHHLGKTYRRRKRYEDSYKCFKNLLEIKPNWHATYGQIVTLGTMKVSAEIKIDAERCMRKLLGDMLEDATQVPLRVSLAAIARMRSYRKITNEIVDKPEKVDKICQIVASAALEDIGQFFEGFVAVTSMFAYHYSDICLALAENVPDMIMVSPQMIDERQWINACEALTNIASYVNKERNSQLFDMLIDKGIEFGKEYLSVRNKVSSYEARAIAKAYILKGDATEALQVISLIPEDKRDHWILYRQAEAENILGQSKAVKTAEKALKLLEVDKKNSNRVSSYYHLLSKCYYHNEKIPQGDGALLKAISLCEDSKYKNELLDYKKSKSDG